jgi:hypothetical protein
VRVLTTTDHVVRGRPRASRARRGLNRIADRTTVPRRLTRALGALAIAIAILLPATLPATAREPHKPLPNYHPRFVTERERGPWNDCLWASASMLVDKWTAGRIKVSKDRLRRMSGDHHKGSSFMDLAPVLRRLGLKARWSPEGGDHVTWSELRKRVRAGGGAVLLGDYSQLPRWYARWDLSFWRKKGAKDNHAIYLDRYDGKRDRFWVMDPLAPKGWRGEWIPTRYLQAYAWQTAGGGLWVLMTPAAKRAPFSGVKLATATATAEDGNVALAWQVRKAPKGWKLPKLDVKTDATRLDDPAAMGLVDVLSIAPGAVGTGSKKRTVRLAERTIEARMAAPAQPGAYRVTLSLRERRFGRTVARAGAMVYVPGERRGTILAKDPSAVVATAPLELDAIVMNTGSVDWSDPAWLTASAAEAMERRRGTVIRASWRLIEPDDPTRKGSAGPDPADLRAVPLKPGAGVHAHLTVPTPSVPGRWALTLDIVDEISGSFAAGGSAPRTMVVKIVERAATGPRR